MIACLYDIHGNLPALEAVLDDARAEGAQRFILGGDYALFGGWPHETLERLRTLDAPVRIRGNVERWTAKPDEAPDDPVVKGAIAACRAVIGAAQAAELGRLEFEAVHDGSRITHASPVSDLRSFFPEPADDEAELLAGVSERRLIFGHTHLAFRRTSPHGGIELVNPGSVGMPLDGDHRASYALLHDDGRIEHRRVAYDRFAAIARLRETFGPASWVDEVCGRLERAALA